MLLGRQKGQCLTSLVKSKGESLTFPVEREKRTSDILIKREGQNLTSLVKWADKACPPYKKRVRQSLTSLPKRLTFLRKREGQPDLLGNKGRQSLSSLRRGYKTKLYLPSKKADLPVGKKVGHSL